MTPLTGFEVLEVRVAELRQLFNAIDPSPFHKRDLDPAAEEFIVDWSQELPTHARLALVVHLERAGAADEATLLRDAINEYLGQRATATRRRLKQLFLRGRMSLAIGLAFLAAAIGVGNAVASVFPGSHPAGVLREGLLIGGWVAMWRPLEIFLYEWWPIQSEARLFDRLAAMPVRIVYQTNTPVDGWRSPGGLDAVKPPAHSRQRIATG